MSIIQTAASEVLVNLLLGIIILAGTFGMYYIQKAAAKVKAQTAQINDAATRTLLDNALTDVEQLAVKTVGAIEQTTAKALREAVKDGKADREELLTLGKQAFNEVKEAILPEAQQLITENLGDFDAYLKKVLENAVRKVKNEGPFFTMAEESIE